MTTRARVALATCVEFSQYDEDAADLLAALAGTDVEVASVPWDDATADWTSYDLVVLRSTWDYAPRRDEFVAWARRVPYLLNSADIVLWNTHKSYLNDLAHAGVPVVPTHFVAPGDPVDLPVAGEYVVKPAVGAGARDTARYGSDEAATARSHIARLHARGWEVMVQPYLTGVDSHGETALLFIGGQYSHSVRKGPLLPAGVGDLPGVYRETTITARVSDPAQLAVAEHALAAVPGGPADLLYARVDLLPGPDGSPLLLELELTEPSLYLVHSSGAADRLAGAIAAAATAAYGP